VLLEEAPADLTQVNSRFVGPAPISPVRASLAPARGATTYQKDDQDREVSLLHNMLTIPSYSCQERALAHYLVEQTQQLGLYSYVDDVGNLIASTHPRETHSELQPIILLGHMDTVRGYIPVRLEDGVLHGRGAVDAKGPLAAFLCAAVRIASSARKDSFQHPIMVIGAVEEESASSRGARAVVDRYQPIACIIGEPSGSQAVTIGYKGRLLVEYRVTRPVHHSAGSQQNSNEVAVTFWNRVCQHAAEWNEQYAPNSTFAAVLPSLRSISSDQDGLEEQVRLSIGYRLPPNYDFADLHSQLVQWANVDGASISFSGQEAAFQTTRTTPLARSFIAAIRATGGQPTFKHKTGTSDMNVVGPAWGQNIVAYGPGDSHLDHTPQEHIHIAEYLHSIDVLETVLKELALASGTTS
jgi:N-acetyl-ornithine/N-acetyl-lysine deacetylase